MISPDALLAVQKLRRPSPNLLWLYLIHSFAGLVFMPLAFVPLYFKYRTLEYHFDDKGVRASWGWLFRHEIFLTYGRIQDIHLRRGIAERWLGLGTVNVQTASGSSSAELSIVGLTQFELVRDFLYSRMRGHDHAPAAAAVNPTSAVLGEIRDELKALNQALRRQGSSRG